VLGIFLHVFGRRSSELGHKVHPGLVAVMLSAALGNLSLQGKVERRKLCKCREELVHS